MTDFKVVPDDLDKAAAGLLKIAEENTKAVAYAKEWMDLEGNAGAILKDIIQALDENCSRIAYNYERLGVITNLSEQELRKAAQMYRTTDAKNAANQDALYVKAEGE
ncbi:type VII secretion target [Nocardia sp. NPDC050710]|uniref:type VII secretion target n=1 Tax=Nocardia sp. NPDC050710 TaxID=3157220 RepID=UPI003403909B